MLPAEKLTFEEVQTLVRNGELAYVLLLARHDKVDRKDISKAIGWRTNKCT